jgi:hypothetical protein
MKFTKILPKLSNYTELYQSYEIWPKLCQSNQFMTNYAHLWSFAKVMTIFWNFAELCQSCEVLQKLYQSYEVLLKLCQRYEVMLNYANLCSYAKVLPSHSKVMKFSQVLPKLWDFVKIIPKLWSFPKLWK